MRTLAKKDEVIVRMRSPKAAVVYTHELEFNFEDFRNDGWINVTVHNDHSTRTRYRVQGALSEVLQIFDFTLPYVSYVIQAYKYELMLEGLSSESNND